MITVAEESGDPVAYKYGWASLGEALDPLGAFDEADDYLSRGLPWVDVLGDNVLVLHLVANLAHCRVRAGRAQEALEVLEEYRALSKKYLNLHTYHQCVDLDHRGRGGRGGGRGEGGRRTRFGAQEGSRRL